MDITVGVIAALLILLMSSVLAKMLRARDARPTHPRQTPAAIPIPENALGSQGASAWGRLDDHQLTRLLSNSAPRTKPNRNVA